MAKKDTRSLVEAFGGALPSADTILASKSTARKAIEERNANVARIGGVVRKAVETVRQSEQKRFGPTVVKFLTGKPEVSSAAAANVLREYARDKGRLQAALQGTPSAIGKKALKSAFSQKYPWAN